MKKLAVVLSLALSLCGSLVCSPVQAKTFVGVLWPMFGPLPAIGLVELVAELKRMPDVQVETYVHQAWPSLVEDLKHLPPGTHTVIVGYSLGANSSVFVANNSKYIDTIIALQPSLLSWNPEVTGKVGRYIEIYNPDPWETFGGMGSRKLIGPNIQYIANNDSHPGAQFDPQFRDLVKSEVAKFTTEDHVETAQADTPKPIDLAAVQGQIIDLHRDAAGKDSGERMQADTPKPAEVAAAAPALPVSPQRNDAGREPVQSAQAEMPPPQQPARLELVADEEASRRPTQQPTQQPTQRPRAWAAFLDTLTTSVDSGDLLVERKLTLAEMRDYVRRTYGRRRPAMAAGHGAPAGGVITTASVAFDRTALAGQ